MKFILQFTIILVFGACLVCSGLELHAHLKSKGLQSKWESSARSKLPYRDKIKGVLELEKEAKLIWPHASLNILVASFASELAQVESDSQRKTELYCLALEEVSEAIKSEPYNSNYLINWASIRQILGEVQCADEMSRRDYRTVIETALNRDPTNMTIIYFAAQMFEWAGDRQRATQLMKKFIRYKVSPSGLQLNFVATLLNDGEDLLNIVPPRFPQVLVWSRRSKLGRPDWFMEYSQEFQILQSNAIELSSAEYRKGLIPAELHLDRLSSSLDYSAGYPIRKQIDTELARYFETKGRETLAEYLKLRSSYKELAILRARLRADSRPNKRALVLWGHNETFALDKNYNSVGFFIAENQSVRLIELVALDQSANIESEHIRILVSNDNQKWIDIEGSFSLKAFNLLDKKIISIEVRSEFFKYWKIHYNSSLKNSRFKNDLTGMLRVYGASYG